MFSSCHSTICGVSVVRFAVTFCFSLKLTKGTRKYGKLSLVGVKAKAGQIWKMQANFWMGTPVSFRAQQGLGYPLSPQGKISLSEAPIE